MALYKLAVQLSLHGYADYAQLVKVNSSPREGEQRYSPGDVLESVPVPIMGLPKRDRIGTSHIERQNLSMRMGMRRMTRLTNAFGKKGENLQAAYFLYGLHATIFGRRHQTTIVSHAMEAAISEHLWAVGKLISQCAR